MSQASAPLGWLCSRLPQSTCYRTLCVTCFVFSDHASDHQLRPTDMPGHVSMKRKAISFDIKKEVIARKEKEEGNTAIGCDLGLLESSVRTIWRKGDKVHASIKAYGASKLIIVNNMQCTLISGIILVTDRPIVVFPMYHIEWFRIERRLLSTYWTFYTRPRCTRFIIIIFQKQSYHS